MSRLYPPQVDSALPAMICSDSPRGCMLTVPFRMNKTVASADVKDMAVIIKTVSTGAIKAEGVKALTFSLNGECWATFELSNQNAQYQPGQYYKVQIAFVDIEGNIGYYSTVGVTKCTYLPQVRIEGLSEMNGNISNLSRGAYIGHYTCLDKSEKVYSYCFTIFDDTNSVVYETTGEQIHNINSDVTSNYSIDSWTPAKMLVPGHRYIITYKVTTTNKLVLEKSYSIEASQRGESFDTNGTFIATMYYDNAYVKLHCKHKKPNETLVLPQGQYIITRAVSSDDFSSWSLLFSVTLNEDTQNPVFCNDYSVEQGLSYQYRLQKVGDDGVLTIPTRALCYANESDEAVGRATTRLIVDFEDMFLFDGERQLRIQYDPKVSSFKPVILENKVNTLGGKYPFIFRNDSVNYKELAISGLISAHMDPDALFFNRQFKLNEIRETTPSLDKTVINGLFSSDSLILVAKGSDQDNTNVEAVPLTPFTTKFYEEPLSTSLERHNFKNEREFKNEVLEWLTNGKPKLLRSPAEGNFIVRILNVSLTPNDTLGRQLHSFSCTACEVAEHNVSNLEKHGFLPSPMI